MWIGRQWIRRLVWKWTWNGGNRQIIECVYMHRYTMDLSPEGREPVKHFKLRVTWSDFYFRKSTPVAVIRQDVWKALEGTPAWKERISFFWGSALTAPWLSDGSLIALTSLSPKEKYVRQISWSSFQNYLNLPCLFCEIDPIYVLTLSLGFKESDKQLRGGIAGHAGYPGNEYYLALPLRMVSGVNPI